MFDSKDRWPPVKFCSSPSPLTRNDHPPLSCWPIRSHQNGLQLPSFFHGRRKSRDLSLSKGLSRLSWVWFNRGDIGLKAMVKAARGRHESVGFIVNHSRSG